MLLFQIQWVSTRHLLCSNMERLFKCTLAEWQVNVGNKTREVSLYNPWISINLDNLYHALSLTLGRQCRKGKRNAFFFPPDLDSVLHTPQIWNFEPRSEHFLTMILMACRILFQSTIFRDSKLCNLYCNRPSTICNTSRKYIFWTMFWVQFILLYSAGKTFLDSITDQFASCK